MPARPIPDATPVLKLAQHPERLNASIVGAATELVCFKLLTKEALKAVRDMGADEDKVSALPLGSFLAYDRLRPGSSWLGKLF